MLPAFLLRAGIDWIRHDEKLKVFSGIRYWNAGKNPEERGPEVLLSFHADRNRAITGHKGLDLHMAEARCGRVAYEDVRIRAITECNNSNQLPPTQLTRYEKLRRIASVTLVSTSVHCKQPNY